MIIVQGRSSVQMSRFMKALKEQHMMISWMVVQILSKVIKALKEQNRIKEIGWWFRKVMKALKEQNRIIEIGYNFTFIRIKKLPPIRIQIKFSEAIVIKTILDMSFTCESFSKGKRLSTSVWFTVLLGWK